MLIPLWVVGIMLVYAWFWPYAIAARKLSVFLRRNAPAGQFSKQPASLMNSKIFFGIRQYDAPFAETFWKK